MKKLILLLSIITLFASCERCWECDEIRYICKDKSTYPQWENEFMSDTSAWYGSHPDTVISWKTYCQKRKPLAYEENIFYHYSASNYYVRVVQRVCIKK